MCLCDHYCNIAQNPTAWYSFHVAQSCDLRHQCQQSQLQNVMALPLPGITGVTVTLANDQQVLSSCYRLHSLSGTVKGSTGYSKKSIRKLNICMQLKYVIYSPRHEKCSVTKYKKLHTNTHNKLMTLLNDGTIMMFAERIFNILMTHRHTHNVFMTVLADDTTSMFSERIFSILMTHRRIHTTYS